MKTTQLLKEMGARRVMQKGFGWVYEGYLGWMMRYISHHHHHHHPSEWRWVEVHGVTLSFLPLLT